MQQLIIIEVSNIDIKKLAADFKAVYKAPTEDLAPSELENLKEIWGRKYPYAISNWKQNWEVVRPFFGFNDVIRRIMYTTNIIKGFTICLPKGTHRVHLVSLSE